MQSVTNPEEQVDLLLGNILRECCQHYKEINMLDSKDFIENIVEIVQEINHRPSLDSMYNVFNDFFTSDEVWSICDQINGHLNQFFADQRNYRLSQKLKELVNQEINKSVEDVDGLLERATL